MTKPPVENLQPIFYTEYLQQCTLKNQTVRIEQTKYYEINSLGIPNANNLAFINTKSHTVSNEF